MAAKPPKPPGSFLKSLLNQHNNNKNQQLLQQQQNNEGDDSKEGNNNKHNSLTATTSTTAVSPADSNTSAAIVAKKKTSCNCSNISIMHLFHEMKQEFPTLADTIVAQCVNENCHQRENCIQMLKHELELNPVPAQSYPAKVLHPPNNNNNLQNLTNHNNTTTTTSNISSIQKPPLQQKPLVVQQKPPLKPIKPIRTAPLQPPTQQQCNSNTNNCAKINSTLIKNTSATTTKSLSGDYLGNNEDVVSSVAGGFVESTDMRTKIVPPQYKQAIFNTADVCNENKLDIGVSEENPPRQRPTTLNLNTQLQKQQQQQRQRLNIQLQQRFQQQRNKQQPQNPTTITKPLRKAPLPPIAPKPSQTQLNSINTNSVNSLANDTFLTNNTTSPISESEISLSVSLSTPSPTSSASPNTATHHPFDKPIQTQTLTHTSNQTKSPIRHRSVITLHPEPPYTRDFLLTPASLSYACSTPSSSPSLTESSTGAKQTATKNSSATSSPTTSVAGSQKSFTSVNLTLRAPVSPNGPNSALQPSTIDITAGPGFSGASGGGKGLHYSSTSYDARLGYQQNFQITVTDECGVFTASRIRPQQQQRCLNQVNIENGNQYDNNSGYEINTNHNNYVNSFSNAQQIHQQQQQFHNNNVLALQQNIQNSIHSPQGIATSVTTSSGYNDIGDGIYSHISGNMCLSPQQAMDVHTQEILQRQKKKRDKLAAALREYKKRLGTVEQEINLLTGTIPTEGLSERLDDEITKLRRDCQDMLRSSNTFTQPSSSQQELAINHQPQQQQMYQLQQQPQPFPRHRITRPSPRPPTPRQTSLDIIQHHSQTTTPHTPPAASLPNLNMYNSLQQQQTNFSLTSPTYHQQQSAPVNTNFNNNTDLYIDHSALNEEQDLVDDTDDYDEYEEVVEPWECNMCTFRNHPQLNICETCENVRIIPGRLTNLNFRALSTSECTNTTVAAAAASNVSPLGLLRDSDSNNATNNTTSRNGLNAVNGNLEHDTNLVQQQIQHFALHT